MSAEHAPGPDPAQPKHPDTKDAPGDVYGGTWSPPSSPQKDPGAGSAPRAPKPKGAPDSEPKSFAPVAPDASRHAVTIVSGRLRRASAWWSPPEMGEHF